MPEFSENNVAFPILLSPDGWTWGDKGKKIKKILPGSLWANACSGPLAGIDPNLHACIERLQPYSRRKKHPELDWLWILHRLDIEDKHRALPVAASVVKAHTFKARVSDDLPPNTFPDAQRLRTETLKTWRSRPFKDGAEVARVRVVYEPPLLMVPNPKTVVEVGCSLSVNVAFGKGRPAHGRVIVPFLQEARNRIVHILDAFAPAVG